MLILGYAAVCGASNQEFFLRGNKAYQAGKYEDALACYEQIPKKGDAVWHNMGNCCYHLNRFVDARLYWQRAQRSAGHDDYCALETQLGVLDVQTGDEEETHQNGWLFWLRSHAASYSLLMIQLVTLAIWFFLCVAIKKHMHWSILLLLSILSIFFIWLSIDTQMRRSGSYAVSTEEIPLFVGPNNSYHQQGVIKQAHTVTITDEREGWYKIAYKGLAGWVQADKLIKV
jgi:tetratricopeptide (TPR) repeat protein